MADDTVNRHKMFPHLRNYLLPSQHKRFKDSSIKDIDTSVAGLSFMAFQSLLSFHYKMEDIKRLVSELFKREETATNKEKVVGEKVRALQAQLHTVKVQVEDLRSEEEVEERARDETNGHFRRAADRMVILEEKLRKLRVKGEEKPAISESKIKTLEEDVESTYILAKFTARTAVMRQHLRGKDPMASAQEELDFYL